MEEFIIVLVIWMWMTPGLISVAKELSREEQGIFEYLNWIGFFIVFMKSLIYGPFTEKKVLLKIRKEQENEKTGYL